MVRTLRLIHQFFNEYPVRKYIGRRDRWLLGSAYSMMVVFLLAMSATLFVQGVQGWTTYAGPVTLWSSGGLLYTGILIFITGLPLSMVYVLFNKKTLAHIHFVTIGDEYKQVNRYSELLLALTKNQLTVGQSFYSSMISVVDDKQPIDQSLESFVLQYKFEAIDAPREVLCVKEINIDGVVDAMITEVSWLKTGERKRSIVEQIIQKEYQFYTLVDNLTLWMQVNHPDWTAETPLTEDMVAHMKTGLDVELKHD